MRQKNVLKLTMLVLYLLLSGPIALTLPAEPDTTTAEPTLSPRGDQGGETPVTVPGADFIVVVHADNPASSISRKKLSKIFLKKLNGWEPVDQRASSAVRKTFSRMIHGRSGMAIETYWQRQIFSGRNTPPRTFDTDEEVLDYVREHPNAVGYVSPSTPIGDGLKVLRILLRETA